jgi:hypothetical protein
MILKLNKNTKPIMSRPGFLYQNNTYYAAWLDATDEDDNSRFVLVVFSEDFSEIYCDEQLEIEHRRFSEAPMDIRFEATPRPGTSLSTEAFIKHVIDKKPLPDLKTIFGWVRDSIDRFVAFDGTLGTQSEMSEFLACWVMSTYATQAFGTVGYLWPTGEKGSGKTQCLNTVIRLSYLGLVTTSSSSFASIRNNAILGGTIGFDDCENIKGMDQNKRELLLAGNTKGAQVTLMEPGKRDGEWNQKYIEAFAPRAFTSIAIPDQVLASRTFTPQLIKSADFERTRRNPSDLNDWRIDPSIIVDCIWLNVAKGFSRILERKSEVGELIKTHGRDFDIFLPSLAIAKWVQDNGEVTGLFERIAALMERYHAQKTEIQLPTPTEILIEAISRLFHKEEGKNFTTSFLVTQFQETCIGRDITDSSYIDLDVQRIGMLLGRLGFKRSSAHGTKRSWDISLHDVRRVAKNQGIELPAQIVKEDEELVSNHAEVTPW